MAYNAHNLSVLAYANGFTLWHYTTTDADAVVDTTGYFNRAADMLRVGDMILANIDTASTPERRHLPGQRQLRRCRRRRQPHARRRHRHRLRPNALRVHRNIGRGPRVPEPVRGSACKETSAMALTADRLVFARPAEGRRAHHRLLRRRHRRSGGGGQPLPDRARCRAVGASVELRDPQVSLPKLATAPIADYDNAFQLPGDCIRVLSAGTGGRGQGIRYKIVHRRFIPMTTTSC